MKNNNNRNGFTIGDRVYLCKRAYEAPIGLSGVIRCFHNNEVLVEFDSSMPFFHDGEGRCADHHGYWVSYDSLRLEIDEDFGVCGINIDDFYNSIK